MATIDTNLMASLKGSQFAEEACSADTTSMYPLTDCYWAGRSAICDIVIAQSPAFGKILFLDKEIQSAESDEALYHEHLIHPIMNSRIAMKNKRVLIVGGGEGATAREVLKWPADSVAQVDWVDIDGDLVDLCRQHLAWADDTVYNDPRLKFYAQDIRVFLHNACDAIYDVIVLDLPDPDTDALLEANKTDDVLTCQLYSRTFWNMLKAHLSPSGAIVSHAGPISPGGDESQRRAGLAWIRTAASDAGLGAGYPYQVTIPSFQGSWGFWMSVPPNPIISFPNGLRVMDEITQALAFTWPAYWHSPWFGHVRGGQN